MIPKNYRAKLSLRPKVHGKVVRLAAVMHGLAIRLTSHARDGVMALYYSDKDGDTPDPMRDQLALQRKIDDVLRRYKADAASFKYFHDLPYQGLAIAGVLGDRMSDYRFDDYELRRWIKPNESVLDIGCNCGFIAVLAAYRIGASAHGIDINPYMIEVGQLVAKHLRVDDSVHLSAGNLVEYRPPAPFDTVLSFATHWTDDHNYRVSIVDHMERMASLLRPGGTLVFETHCNDVGSAEFYEGMASVKDRLFRFDGVYKKTDAGTRELYIMQRI